MAWLPQGLKNFEDIFIRFGATHERDRRTDRQTDGQTPHAGNSRAMHSIARQLRNVLNTNFFLLLYIQNFNYQSGHISPQSCISPVPSRHPFVIYRHTLPTRIKKCTKFGQLILRKIIKIVATRCQILRLKCTKFERSPRPPSWI